MSSKSQRRSEQTIKKALVSALGLLWELIGRALNALSSKEDSAPRLKPLTPRYDSAEHKVYVDAVEFALIGSAAADIHNIALTGAYGAGKSSVLSEIVRKHPKAVQISLSTLGGDVVVKPDDKEPKGIKAETPTNRIQKEIVKQLLYQAGPTQLPGSRYRQLGRLRKRRTLGLALSIGLVLALLLYVTTFTEQITHLFMRDVPTPLAPVAVSWLVATAGIFAIIALFHNRISIDQFGAASATISLSRKSETFFDEYLDEIVYFFEVSKQDIVIFEDIDRFDEPNIFETLRALNTLLNSAKQLRGRNIRFIYAIKDSIFDALSKQEAAEQAEGDKHVNVDAVAAEIARANRTKFFDLVVPIVPFVTHLSARDLMHGVMKDIEPTVNAAVMDLVAGELPDMRLIIEARNEYLIFSQVVLSKGLTLSPTSLFAMMLYKSTHLSDFEAIRKGDSQLDRLYDLRGELVRQNLASLNARSTVLRRQITLQRNLQTRTNELGDNLVNFALRMRDWQGQPAQGSAPRSPSITFDGQNYSATEVRDVAFWKAYAANPGSLSITVTNYPYSSYNVNLTKFDVRSFIVPALSDEKWFQKSAEEIDRELEQIRVDRLFLAHASMQDLYAEPRFIVEADGQTRSFADVARDLIPSTLARRLIEKGYIDADFTLYTSKYYGDRVTARASNFILHNIDRGLIDMHAPLDAGEVESILRERSESVLTERAVLNIAIFDHLLKSDGQASQTLVERFVSPDTDELAFLEAYLAEGKQRLTFTRRLASVWSGLLPFVVERVDVVEGVALKLLDSALRGLDEDIEPDVCNSVKEAIDAHYGDLGSLTADEDVPVEAIADALARANVSINDLSVLTPSMRAAVVARSLYPVTRSNLHAAVVTSDIALDRLREEDEDVYRHALAHAANYLVALRPDEATVTEPDNFAAVVNDVAEQAEDVLEDVIRHAGPDCMIGELSGTAPAAWPALAENDRFPATLRNVEMYIDSRKVVDTSLGGRLERAGTVSTDAGDDDDARLALAINILGAREAIPSASIRVQLAASLDLSNYIPADQITAEPGDLIALLVAHAVIEDDVTSFELTSGLDWATREQAIVASATFISFLDSSGIRPDEVPLVLESTTINRNVKDKLTLSSPWLVPNSYNPGFSAVARYAVANNIEIDIAELIRMADARIDEHLVLDLLNRHLDSSSVADLAPLLVALGPNYARLIERTRRVSRVPDTPAGRHLTDRLHTLNTVSSTTPGNGELNVYMYH